MRYYQMTLLLLPMLLFMVGCSVDSVEESDANILDPATTDFHFQNLPLAGGSLIPLDEIPVITIEKTREDDDFYYWRVLADPAPTREDLVVGVSLKDISRGNIPVKLKNLELDSTFSGDFAVWNNAKLKDRVISMNVRGVGSSEAFWHFGNEGYFYNDDFSDLIVVVIPKFENTSLEFTLPQGAVLVREKDSPYNFLIRSDKLPELPVVEGGWVELLDVGGEIAEDVIVNMEFVLEVVPPWRTTAEIIDKRFIPAHEDDIVEVFAVMDLPVFRTFDNYIIREGFAFSYYMLGESSSLELRPPPDPE